MQSFAAFDPNDCLPDTRKAQNRLPEHIKKTVEHLVSLANPGEQKAT